MTHIFSFPTPIHFGAGVRHQVADFIKLKGFRKPLIVTDRGVSKLDYFFEFIEELKASDLNISIFSEIFGNPVRSQVYDGVKSFNENECDSVIAVGGGAVLDVAKAIVLMINHPGDLFDYEDGRENALPVDNDIPFWIAMPTTSGTGSEVGRSAVISDDLTHMKKIIFSPRLLPPVVFADPELTLDIPEPITAATGMDALTHLVEAYLARGYHPICDGIALEGIQMVANNLSVCVNDPKNLQARSEMMMAAMMGAIAFQKGLGLVHSCAHALSTVSDLHHGLANGLMITHALKFNVPIVPEKFVRMGIAIGLENPGPDSFFKWLENLKKEIAMPMTLGEVNIGKDKVERLSEVAIMDVCHQNNPRECTQDDFRNIFEEAL